MNIERYGGELPYFVKNPHHVNRRHVLRTRVYQKNIFLQVSLCVFRVHVTKKKLKKI